MIFILACKASSTSVSKVPPWKVRSFNPVPSSSYQITSANKRRPYNICWWNQWGFCLPGWDRKLWENQVLFSIANTQNLIHRHTLWAPVKGWQLREDWNNTVRGWVLWLQGEWLKDSCQCFCVESLFYTTHTHHLSSSISLYKASASGVTLAKPLKHWTNFTVLLSWKAKEEVQADSGVVRDSEGKTELCGSRVRAIFLHVIWMVPTFLYRVLPPHGHILICFSLMNSTCLTLMTPDTSHHHHSGIWQLTLVYTENFVEWPQHWHQVWTCY